MSKARELTYAFLKLPYHTQMEILLHLELTGKADKGLENMELFKIAFRRAKERGIVDVLKEQIESYG